MDIVALIVSILAFLLSLVQFLRDASRGKKEATLNALYALQNDAFNPLNKLLMDKRVDASALNLGSDGWRTVTTALVKLEYFSVGINTNIYSIKILNRVAGAYFIRLYEDLAPVIAKKRSQNISKGKHYAEFQQTVYRLKEMRKHKKYQG